MNKSNTLSYVIICLVTIPYVTGSLSPFLLYGDQNFPFPQEINFNGCIKPAITQEELNKDIITFYEQFKFGNDSYPGYLFHYPSPDDHIYYINAGYTGEIPEGWNGIGAASQSEATGYGMIIFALMAGYDSEAQRYFDGLFNLYLTYKSNLNNYAMSWIVPEIYDPGLPRSASATDGDLDIAYALVLAHHQWGSADRDYIGAAKNIINNGILEYDISHTTKRLLLGDWNRGLDGIAVRLTL